jgi:hypothetical protein
MRIDIKVSRTLCAAVAFAAVLLAPMCASASASVVQASPRWTISAVSRPTNFRPGGDIEGDRYIALITNTGGAASSGPVTITDELPEGITAAPGIVAFDERGHFLNTPGYDFAGDCEAAGEAGNLISCTYSEPVVPDDTLIIQIPVHVAASPPDSCAQQLSASAVSCVTNVVRVVGGGAPSPGSGETETLISEEKPPFGISPGSASATLSSAQAGAHADLTVTAGFNTENADGGTVGYLKNTTFDLPPGFAGDLVDTPACSGVDFLREECPTATQVGVTTITLDYKGEYEPKLAPVYNLVPETGYVAKLGFTLSTLHYEGDVKVREPGEGGILPSGPAGEPYGLTTTFYNSTGGIIIIDDVALSVWGDPASPVHNALRFEPGRDGGGVSLLPSGLPFEGAAEVPYLSSPTSCPAQPLQAAFFVTSWQEPLQSQHPLATPMSLGSLVGCDRLGMEPSLTAEVSTDKAASATGLDVDTKVPQTYENAEGLATSTLKDEVVTLPEGMTVNPSAGAGLAACSEQQYEEEGAEYVEGRGCPNESRLASVRIVTPSLKEEILGSVFLATSAPRGEAGKNPFNSLLAVYLVARLPARGVLVKSPGEIELNPVTGQLTTSFDDLPALPFSLAKFEFNQGAGAPLVTPATCGAFAATARLTPYSDPEGSPLSLLIPPFEITKGVEGGACPSGGVPPFKPRVASYTIHPNAGIYSPFYLKIERKDGEQEITKFTTIFPPGLTGNLSGIPFCSEADIEAARSATGTEELEDPSCPAASEIGYSVAEAGVGSQLAQTPGKIYLAGAYHGSALSVVSITAAKVGPFDLGTVVIRFGLSINPITAQVEINGAESDPIPHIIQGIVVHVRDVRVYIDREKFILNPTSCEASQISETVTGAGANPADPADQMTVGASAPFQVADCSSLQFKPTFKVSTSGKTSRTQGASLSVKLTYPANALGTQANIKSVKVDLPKQLPSRLTTLQKACTAAQFEANPAGCPADSRVGQAKAVTPILPVPLEGPAYFVSYGGAKFPELVVVLQGYGFTIDLHGETFINKAGITSSTFHAVPDEPVGSFELTLPEGPYSALAANGNFCASKLEMPTAFTAQNGDTIHQSTPISVTGCPKHKTKVKAKHKKGKTKTRHKK